MEWATIYAIFLGFAGGASFSFVIGYLQGMRFGQKETERWLIPRVEHFAEIVAEQHEMIEILKQHHAPFRGSKNLAENILTRGN